MRRRRTVGFPSDDDNDGAVGCLGADGDDEDIGEALSANIDAALDLIALRAT